MSDDYVDNAPPSMRKQIEDLGIGESFCRAKRFDGDEVSKDLLRSVTRGLRFALNPTVQRAKQNTGHTYLVEEGEVRTTSRDFIVIVAVTRVH